jgi:hypothetical protein
MEPDAVGASKPRLSLVNRLSYLRIADQTRFSRPAAMDAERRRQGLAALEKLKADKIMILHIVRSDRSLHCYFHGQTHELAHVEELSGEFVRHPRWKQLFLAWKPILMITGILALVAYSCSPTALAGAVVFLVALVPYFLVLCVFGPRYSHVGIVPAFIIAVLGGLLWGAFLRAGERRHQIERQRQELKR